MAHRAVALAQALMHISGTAPRESRAMPHLPEKSYPTEPNTEDTAALPRVTILLATYNGARHLHAQLMSYVAQTGVQWDLWISDDGSTDDTRAVIAAFRTAHGSDHTIRLIEGPQRGAAANFMSLLTHPELPVDEPVALSDQDDLWHKDKLARALRRLRDSPPCSLYSGQSYHADRDLKVTGRSRPPRRTPGFRNALTQNVVSGHSIVMDVQALALVRQAGVPVGIPYHDWWLYLLISGAGGTVHVDDAPMVHYRQHADNTMGAHDGLRATLLRAEQVMGRTYGGWIATNAAALRAASPLLTSEHRDLLELFEQTRPGPARARALWQAGLYRQTRLASAFFYLAAVLGRV
jgi:glycosyltransferase involved in cell wall biosynthesis